MDDIGATAVDGGGGRWMDQEMRGANWSRLMDTPPCRRCVLYRLMRLRLDDEMGRDAK